MRAVVIVAIILFLSYLTIAQNVEQPKAKPNAPNKAALVNKASAQKSNFKDDPNFKNMNAFLQKVYKNELKNGTPTKFASQNDLRRVAYTTPAVYYEIAAKEIKKGDGSISF